MLRTRVGGSCVAVSVSRALPLSLGLFCVSGPALAAGYSVDVELLRPAFGSNGLVGVDSPQVREEGRWRLGYVGQYQRDPLVLYEREQEVGTIVRHRVGNHLGLAYDVLESISVRLVLPTYYQRGTDVPELAASGVAAGDLGLGAAVRALDTEPLDLGLRIDLTFPTSRADYWVGETNLRTGGALLAHLDLGPFDTLAELGTTLRTDVATEEDFTLGSELQAGLGVRYGFLDEAVSPYLLTVARSGLSEFLDGGAETPAESVLGVQVRPTEPLLLDLGFGRGWSEGYGTTQNRVLLGLTWVASLPSREPAPVPQAVVITEPPPELPPAVEPEPEEEDEPWQEGQLARVEGQKIRIREPVQFEFATARILPESLPLLYQVAGLLNENDRIVHVVIEGHASEEGSYEYNYDLSIRRARAIWEQLIRGKVNPNRISYRGMGEVVPRTAGSSEGELADNRRVDFHIVHQLGPLDLTPSWPSLQQLPWDGGDPAAQEELPAVSPTSGVGIEVETYTVDPSGGRLPAGEPAPPAGVDKGREAFDPDAFDLDLDDEEEVDVELDPMDRMEVIRQGDGDDEDEKD